MRSARAAVRNIETEMHEHMHVAMLKAYKQLLRRKCRAETQQELGEMSSGDLLSGASTANAKVTNAASPARG